MNTNIKNLVDEVKEFGVAKTHVSEIFNEKDMGIFNEVLEYYKEFSSAPSIVDRCERIASGNPIRDRGKFYEITQYQHLGRPLNLDDPIIKLYMRETLIGAAEYFYSELPRVRNILTWIHPKNPQSKESNSQIWHRDQEDWKTLKVFINFSDITLENGATQYIKQTHHGAKYQDITNNFSGHSFPLKYQPPKENFTDLSGPVGTLHLVNSNGVHKGGLVKSGARYLSHAIYLSPKAPLILNGTLAAFDCYKWNNSADINSDTYKNLSDRQKYIIGK